MPVSVRRGRALGAAVAALLVAKAWLALAPAAAVRWGTRMAPAITRRGSRGLYGYSRDADHADSTDSRDADHADSTDSRDADHADSTDSTGRGSRGHGFVPTRVLPLGDPRDPGPVDDPRDPRPVDDPRDPRPVEKIRVEKIRDLSAAVTAIGRRPPFSATCLEQSLALVMLLALARMPAHIVLGVSRAAPTLRAHAWVECGGAVVHGGAHAAGFAPLLRPSPSSSSVPSSCPG